MWENVNIIAKKIVNTHTSSKITRLANHINKKYHKEKWFQKEIYDKWKREKKQHTHTIQNCRKKSKLNKWITH